MSKYTFLIKTDLDLLNKAWRELCRMRSARKQRNLEDETDHAFNLAVTLWQLKDWVWLCNASAFQPKPATKKEFVEYLFTSCPELKICSEIANGSKHFVLDKDRYEKVVDGVALSVPPSSILKVEYPVLKIVLNDGSRRVAEDVFKRAFNFWKDKLLPT